MRCLFAMFVTTACFLFLLKLKWPKNKNIYQVVLSVISTEFRSVIFPEETYPFPPNYYGLDKLHGIVQLLEVVILVIAVVQ